MQRLYNMKKFLLCFLIAGSLILSGCGQKEFSYGVLQRDAYNTGGGISFEYDPLSHTAYFGGEGEILEWYEEDVAKGWNEAGNRVGIKIIPPKGLDDYKSASATLDDEKLEYEDFYVGEENSYTLFQPLIKKEGQILTLKIKWQESAAEQVYTIIIKKGTILLQE